MKRPLLVCFLAVLLMQLMVKAPTFSHDGPPTVMNERQELLQRGEAALAHGEAGQAIEAFERASTMLHAADSEMGLVRAYMQNGAYRRALSFGAHAAGAHRDTPAGAVLYAWLLHVGGQTAFAQRLLDGIVTKNPHDVLVRLMQAQLRTAAPIANGALLSGPWRPAPFDSSSELPATARVACSGVLIDKGRHALAPMTQLGEARTLWVRDGLGRRKVARVERRVESLGLMLLQLNDPFASVSDLMVASRDPLPGSPGFAFDYAVSSDAAPAWPFLRAGFVGKSDDRTGLLKLGIETLAGAQGGPVFNHNGHFTGIALQDATRQDRLLPVSVLTREFGELFGTIPEQASIQRAPFDAIYEMAMPVTLQVIVE